MKKMFNYFIHPSNMAKIDDVLRMRMSEGSAGYGIYMQILELLRDCPDYRTKYDPAVIAWGIHENNIEQLRQVCESYNLFTISDDGYLFSPWLKEIMSEHEERREKLSKAGRASAEARARNVKRSQNTSELPMDNASTVLNGGGEHRSSNVDCVGQQNKTNNTTEKKETTSNHDVKRYDISSDWRVEDFSDVCREKTPLLDKSALESLKKSPRGHNFEAVVECSLFFKLTVNQSRLLMAITHNGKIGSPELMELLRCKNHCRESDFKPIYPMNYLLQNIYKAIHP